MAFEISVSCQQLKLFFLKIFAIEMSLEIGT